MATAVLAALSIVEVLCLAASAGCLLGYASVITAAGCNITLQLGLSDDMRGRVIGFYTLIHGGLYPIAAPLIGAVSKRSSIGIAFFVWGAGGLATLAVLMGARHRLERRRSALASTP